MAGSIGFAGIAAGADSAETASSNPAGMSRLTEPTATVSLMSINSIGEFQVDEAQTITAGGDPDNEFRPMFLPQAYYVRPLSDDVHVGISLTVPSGFGTEYGSD
ncbi:MAG TPA: outer membrane protein transport protein, partial [Pseudomonas sp.]|nr:outer membrane protein transport protein [Pseudomonas sp.]